MRITYRSHDGSFDYWQKRWEKMEVDSGDLNLSRYPGKYVEESLKLVISPNSILEAGCGAGRVAIHYHNKGYNVQGFDYVYRAVANIQRKQHDLPLLTADITNLPFKNATYNLVLAFGLYHGLEAGLQESVRETRRVMTKGGILCASMRLDNLQNLLIDLCTSNSSNNSKKSFHKRNLKPNEIRDLFEKEGFVIERKFFVENMPFFYKFKLFRSRKHRKFKEELARAEGYQLAFPALVMQKMLMFLFPKQFANLQVIIARAC